MIKLIRGGCYYMGGALVKENQAFLTADKKEEARKGTMAYRILRAHNQGGEEDLKLKFDAIASHDITYVGIIQTAKASGLEKFPLSYTLTNCHNSRCARSAAPSTKTTTSSAFPRRKSTARTSCRRTSPSSTSICARSRRRSAA